MEKSIKELLFVFFGEDKDWLDDTTKDELEFNNILSEEKGRGVPWPRFRYGDRCGFAASGIGVYVVNPYNDRSIKVTIQVNYRTWDGDTGKYDKKFYISAGSERNLGCTRGSRISDHSYSFSVIGCEVT